MSRRILKMSELGEAVHQHMGSSREAHSYTVRRQQPRRAPRRRMFADGSAIVTYTDGKGHLLYLTVSTKHYESNHSLPPFGGILRKSANRDAKFNIGINHWSIRDHAARSA